MVQDQANDYDIDDGVYFDAEQLVTDAGTPLSPLQARQLVRDAVDDQSFVSPPEVRKNCVRVLYQAGYHVDLPVYRVVKTVALSGEESVHFELASTIWKRSDARDVTEWFEAENIRQSADSTNGRQLRRIVRLLKKFARSRNSWKADILSGFGITKLVTELFCSELHRDDRALILTMRSIRDRLNTDLRVEHPVTPGDTITEGDADPKAVFLRNKLSEALSALEPILSDNCSEEAALKCWDTVFNTRFFSDQTSERHSALTERRAVSAGILADGATTPSSAVRKDGGGRYA